MELKYRKSTILEYYIFNTKNVGLYSWQFLIFEDLGLIVYFSASKPLIK